MHEEFSKIYEEVNGFSNILDEASKYASVIKWNQIEDVLILWPIACLLK